MATTPIGRRIRAMRQQRGLSQQALADSAQLNRLSVLYLESGRHRSPGSATLQRLAKALGCTPNDLLGVSS